MHHAFASTSPLLYGRHHTTVTFGGTPPHVTHPVRGYTASLCGWTGPGQLDGGLLGLSPISSAHAVMRVFPQCFGTASTQQQQIAAEGFLTAQTLTMHRSTQSPDSLVCRIHPSSSPTWSEY